MDIHFLLLPDLILIIDIILIDITDLILIDVLVLNVLFN